MSKKNQKVKHWLHFKGWQLYSPYLPTTTITQENLEDLEDNYDPIFEIKKQLRSELFNYEDDLRIWIK